MLVEGACQIVATREIEVDCGASELGGAGLHRGGKGASNAFAALVARGCRV